MFRFKTRGDHAITGGWRSRRVEQNRGRGSTRGAGEGRPRERRVQSEWRCKVGRGEKGSRGPDASTVYCREAMNGIDAWMFVFEGKAAEGAKGGYRQCLTRAGPARRGDDVSVEDEDLDLFLRVCTGCRSRQDLLDRHGILFCYVAQQDRDNDDISFGRTTGSGTNRTLRTTCLVTPRDSRVHSFAVLSWSFRFLRYRCAMSGIKGSCGFGSARSEATERRTLTMERAGDHWFLSCTDGTIMPLSERPYPGGGGGF